MSGANGQLEAASSGSEQSLILVDEHDREIGFASREACHRGAGLLHRAFSVFVFRTDGRLWLQQRAAAKRLWPRHWSNTCCSHPRRGERIAEAAQRRLRVEAGLPTPVEYVYRFEYQAAFDESGAEHELCSVFVGVGDDAPSWNEREVLAARCMTVEEIDAVLSCDPESFTPWFRLEWGELRKRGIPGTWPDVGSGR